MGQPRRYLAAAPIAPARLDDLAHGRLTARCAPRCARAGTASAFAPGVRCGGARFAGRSGAGRSARTTERYCRGDSAPTLRGSDKTDAGPGALGRNDERPRTGCPAWGHVLDHSRCVRVRVWLILVHGRTMRCEVAGS
jgi:hypothetical protein